MGRVGEEYCEFCSRNPSPRAVLGANAADLGMLAYLLASSPFDICSAKLPVAGVVVGVFGWVRRPTRSWPRAVRGVVTEGWSWGFCTGTEMLRML